jgi:glycerophosphoryl diester phosphodiesterase
MVLIGGHRGAKGYEPENTLLSFQKALDLRVDIIELDVHCSKDKKLVVIHDESVDRTTNKVGLVKSFTLEELKKLDAGKKQQIPTLEEVIDLVNKKLIINIEIKDVDAVNEVCKIIKHYVDNEGWSYDNFLVSSFNHNLLLVTKRNNPKILVASLIENIPPNYFNLIDILKPFSINISYKNVTKELILDAHKREMKVFVWTVNDEKDIERMKLLHVDGIFSDYPDRI